MDGQTHAALGAATALVVIRPAEPTTLIATAAVGAFAGILPDIDTGGKVAPIIHKITAAFLVLFSLCEILLIAILLKICILNFIS